MTAVMLKDALTAVTGMTASRAAMASGFAGSIASRGDLLWPDPRPRRAADTEAHEVAAAVSAGLFLLADCPGGVSFSGQHWCTAPHPGCPGPGEHDGCADAAKGTGAVHTPLWLAAEVTAPALDALAYRPGPLDACKPDEWKLIPAARIADLKVADISCGSGSFLLAAWGYLTGALMTAWRAEGDPRGTDPAEAGRIIAARCLYGADLSRASVALCRLALQLAAYQPGLPVAGAGRFVVGDSLLGTDFAAEWPEVFAERGGFDAVIGNPPFLGGHKITGQLGTAYRDKLVAEIARGRKGSADLSAYFLLRAWDLVNPCGQVAILATNTLVQGATLRVGLDQVGDEGGEVRWAIKSEPWPDKRASLQYCAGVISKAPVADGAPRRLKEAARHGPGGDPDEPAEDGEDEVT
jgi:hypothetical protein